MKYLLMIVVLFLAGCATIDLRQACDNTGGVFSETPDLQVCIKQIGNGNSLDNSF